MSLRPSERTAILAVLPVLDELWGPIWRLPSDSTLADTISSEKTPECIIGNGELTAAIEVKRLTGDAGHNNWTAYLKSLSRSLAPPEGGRFSLLSPAGMTLPFSTGLARHLRRQIRQVTPLMSLDDRRVITIPPRSGTLELLRRDKPSGMIFCNHNSPPINTGLAGLPGWFYLKDAADHIEHSLISEDCQTTFRRIVESAARAMQPGERREITWNEEWELIKASDTLPGRGSVQLPIPYVGSVPDAVEATISAMLQSAMLKFERVHADRHVIVLHDDFFDFCEPNEAASVIDSQSALLDHCISLVVLLHREEAHVIWHSSEKLVGSYSA